MNLEVDFTGSLHSPYFCSPILDLCIIFDHILFLAKRMQRAAPDLDRVLQGSVWNIKVFRKSAWVVLKLIFSTVI
jgi:hypothetical protein